MADAAAVAGLASAIIEGIQSLGLAVEVLDDESEALHFGKQEDEEQLPDLGMGLELLNLPGA